MTHIVLLGLFNLLGGDSTEPVQWQELDEQAPRQLEQSYSDTEEVLEGVQRNSLNGLRAKRDHQRLGDERDNKDHEEQRIVAEICEHVELISLKLARIDLVDDLQDDERLENDSVM